MAYQITRRDLEATAEHINRVLQSLGVDIGASIDGASGGVQLRGDNGSRTYNDGHIPKRELYNQMHTVLNVLYEVSRQQRVPD